MPDATWARVLREYALLADGERGALLGPNGDIVWMCAPRWDSEAVFSQLLGGRGRYVLTPSSPDYVWGGYYEDDSLIWRTRWVTAEGAVECREALALPADEHRVVVLRRLQAVDRPAQAQCLLDPRAEFGRKGLRELRRRDDGAWTGRTGSLYLRWSGAAEARRSEEGLVLEVSAARGESVDLVLEVSDQPLPDEPVDAGQAWVATETAWRSRAPALGPVIGERDARHSYMVMSGLTSSSGGMVAAATASLPERTDAGRNYDYRFCWVRDQCYAGRAAAADGPHRLLDSAIGFITERILDDGPGLKPAYTNRGDQVPLEREISSLMGYPGGGNTIGNQIDQQFQLDAFGEVLLLLAAGARHDRLTSDHWRAAEIAVDAIRQRGGEPDAGIWELGNRRWAHSRLICAAGLRSIATAAPASQAAAWVSLADEMVASATRDCLHPSGRWQRAADDERVDAALLLPAIRGGIAPEDPRSRATLDAVLSDLSHDDFIYRFRHDARPLQEAEGVFLLCGFFAALAMHQIGEPTRARAFYERSRAACGPPGLFSEEYDVRQRQLRGNIPQAFVHALMLETSVRLARPWVDEHVRPQEEVQLE